MTDEVVTEDVTYIGRRRIDLKGTVAHGYLRSDGSDFYHKQPLVTGAPVGVVITVSHPADRPTATYFGGDHAPRIARMSGAAADVVLEWEATDQAIRARKAQEDATKRAVKRAQSLEAHIDALRVAAQGLTGVDRAAFARHVEDRIRGY